ncbi:Ribosome biogenesis protein ENP2 [Paragonimus kellicotti]|nr:Ribosome biogenesis protein ENP2 [Paragonimus kellicotti]
MNVFKLNGIKVYNLTANRALPEWASRSEKKRKFSQDSGLSKHLELIQELEMPDSATYITCSPDSQYLFTLGRYKPRVRCYELENLSLKFDRCVDCLPYRMEILSDDYSKFALLEEERWVDVHATGGHFFKFRIPRPGVDISYSPFTCDLFVASSRSAIYRMNLGEGRFNTPLVSSKLEGTAHGFTACAYCKEHSLLLGASTLGRVDGWDARTGECVFGMNVSEFAPISEDAYDTLIDVKRRAGVTCVKYKDPLNIALGTSDGMVYIYDLRQNRKPWHTRDTEFRKPVKTVEFHEDKLISLLPHCLKIWYIDTGKVFVGFDTGRAECNWMHHFPNSGLLMIAMESPKISTFFVPLLGEAPAWCSHLDQLVLECEPDVTTMYDGYKFLTRQQLAELGMLELVGTQFLRAYMHGYFVSIRLYNKVKDRLGIISESIVPTVKVTKPESTVENHKDSLDWSDELQKASADTRFLKLNCNPKLIFNANDEESDLMRIHQARLLKKRKRKEARKERARRSQALVSHPSDAVQHSES